MKNRLTASIKKPTSKRTKQDQLRKAALIYDEWKTSLINTPTPADKLPEKLNQLVARLEMEITDPDVLKAAVEMVQLKIGDTYLAKQVGMFTIKINATCPNMVTINNVLSICNWQGDSLVNRENWAKKKCSFTCPKCDQTITQEAMTEVKTVMN